MVRSGGGEQWCPNSRRRFQTHWERICQNSCPQGAWEHQRSGSCSPSSSAKTVSNDPRCKYRSSRSLVIIAGASSVLTKSSYTTPLRWCPTFCRGMRRNDHTHTRAPTDQMNRGAIIQFPDHPAFWMDTTNCGRARKHRQHFWTTQQGIVPTPRNDAQSHRQNIAEHRCISIRAI